MIGEEGRGWIGTFLFLNNSLVLTKSRGFSEVVFSSIGGLGSAVEKRRSELHDETTKRPATKVEQGERTAGVARGDNNRREAKLIDILAIINYQ